MTTAIHGLAEAAGVIAAEAARVWFNEHPEFTYEMDTLISHLQANIKERTPRALMDAETAINNHMVGIATRQFEAEMILAGIDAARCCYRVR